MEQTKVLNGIDLIGSVQDDLRYDRIALLTTGSALNRWMMPALQFINDRFDLKVLFGAEYGIMGEKEAGERYESYTDVWTGLKVFSLYRFGASSLSSEMLHQFDTLIIDIPLTGTRYCSSISTIHALLRQLGGTDKKVLILDRPNPLGGQEIDGPVLNASLKLNDDDFALPARFGLTLGELCLMMNEEDRLGADIQVVKAKNWYRDMTFEEFNQPWIVSQMHLPRFESCILSIGLEVLRGTNLSVGLGTSLPFELVGAPYLDAIQLTAALNKRNISGVIFSPIYFTPTTDIYQGISCQGVQIHVLDTTKIRSTSLMLHIVDEIIRLAGPDFIFTQDRQGKYRVDYLFGNNRLRRQPDDWDFIMNNQSTMLESYEEKVKPYLLYPTKAEALAKAAEEAEKKAES